MQIKCQPNTKHVQARSPPPSSLDAPNLTSCKHDINLRGPGTKEGRCQKGPFLQDICPAWCPIMGVGAWSMVRAKTRPAFGCNVVGWPLPLQPGIMQAWFLVVGVRALGPKRAKKPVSRALAIRRLGPHKTDGKIYQKISRGHQNPWMGQKNFVISRRWAIWQRTPTRVEPGMERHTKDWQWA